MSAAQSAYVDDTGHPRLKDSIVAFFDILGFSQIAMTSATTGESQQVLDRIFAAIRESRDFVRKSLAQGEGERADRAVVKFFSDNLSLGYPLEEQADERAKSISFIIRCTQRYQLRMVLNGFFIRGALTRGPICLTDEIIFGSALIECYQLESKASIVPRIILTDPLWQAVAGQNDANLDRIPSDIGESICRDVDGWWFVNYLQAAWNGKEMNWDVVERHKQSILESLANTTRHDVLPKFGWACRYHNVFCHWHRDAAGYSDRYRIDRVDEQSTITRLSDMSAG